MPNLQRNLCRVFVMRHILVKPLGILTFDRMIMRTYVGNLNLKKHLRENLSHKFKQKTLLQRKSLQGFFIPIIGSTLNNQVDTKKLYLLFNLCHLRIVQLIISCIYILLPFIDVFVIEFIHSIFQSNYVIIVISIKYFLNIKILFKISFIVLTIALAKKVLQIYKYLL